MVNCRYALHQKPGSDGDREAGATAMPYRAPLDDIRFCLHEMVGIDRLKRTGAYPALEDGTGDAVLDEAARTFEARVAPAHRVADEEGARLENGVVRTPQAFHDAFEALRQGGWFGLRGGAEHGGMEMPMALTTPCNEMLGSSCLALSLNPLLTQGVVGALERHADPSLKALYLPRLLSGEWAGTMNLTEAHAGSDVGALRTRAEPNGDGSWSVTGQKIFISWGESDLTENIVHLVLARTPGAPEGTAGISLFLVPKRLPESGVRNGVRALSLERKMGLHGSPTAVLEYDGARGWLVGGERNGMRCMFTMMNAARLGVGLQGVAVAEGARQLATEYALERSQGPTADGDRAIVGHADVRRMVLEMRAMTEAARAVCYDLSVEIDLSEAEPDKERRAAAARRAALLTPIAKGFGSEAGVEVASLGIQIHGGAGYVEETGAAQWFRDARIATIYEGTNGIQAMDLVGRKILPDEGREALRALGEARDTAQRMRETGGALRGPGESLARSVASAEGCTVSLCEAGRDDARSGAVAYLRLMGLVRGAHHLGRGALAAPDEPVRTATAAVFCSRILPMAHGYAEAATAQAAPLYAIPRERLVA